MDELTLETKFVELGDGIKLQIKVSIESAKKGSKAILKGSVKSEDLSKLLVKRGKPKLSFESKWCKTKYPRLSFGQIAVLATQKIAHDEITYLC